jgi:hypothetical protein
LPYPQQVDRLPGVLKAGPPVCTEEKRLSKTGQIAMDSLRRYLPHEGAPIRFRLGSIEEGYDSAWLTPEQNQFLAKPQTSPEASVLRMTPEGVTAVGKGRWGMLYGVQTVNQLAIEAGRARRDCLPCLEIRDWPDVKWRCLAPALTWYSGFNRLEGYDLNNWSRGEWKWLVDWSLLHKCNAWAVCMCGYWPFTLPGYPESILDVQSDFFNPATGKKERRRFVHPNIQHEFYPEVIRYAQERGIKVHAYTAINSFVGGYLLHHPDAGAGGAAELLPFHPGVDRYVDAFLGRMVEMGFDGFVWENPEANHVPNQNAECYRTFWEPWAKTYGFSSVAGTNQNAAPLGVHVEYMAWLFNQYNGSVQRHAKRLGLPPREIFLVSHFLLARILDESKTLDRAKEWLDRVDRKQGTKVQWIVAESREADYVKLLGGDRVASLGGRGGACTSAMRRIASINNNWEPGSMGTGIDWERSCHRRILQAGGSGSIGYILEWRLSEIFAYLAAQYLWRSAGPPGVNNDDQIGFLDYAYRVHYGDRVGALAARALDNGSNVNEAMVMEGVYGSQYPETGQPLHRDYQYLAVQADEAVRLAEEAYRLFAGKAPNLEEPLYRQEDFCWDGYGAKADHLFKAETLRRLCVSTRRSQKMCDAAMAHRLAMRLAAEKAPLTAVFEQLDRAVAAAEANQRLYQLNYDDDDDWTDGLCVRLADRFRSVRDQFVLASGLGAQRCERAWLFDAPGKLQGWTLAHDTTAPVVEQGGLKIAATGNDPLIVLGELLSIPVSEKHFAEIRLASDRSGRAELFWTDRQGAAAPGRNHLDFGQHEPAVFNVTAGPRATTFFLLPKWKGTLTGLRLDIPDKAKVQIQSIRIGRRPEGDWRAGADLSRPTPETASDIAAPVLLIPWEKQTDVLPEKSAADRPGAYLAVKVGLNADRDFNCHAVVFTVQTQAAGGPWRTVFRRAVGKNSRGWEDWKIPLGELPPGKLRVRFMTDSYSRARDRAWPSWQWALWGQPQLIERTRDGQDRVAFDFARHWASARPYVRLDADGRDHPFDRPGEDSSGATWRLLDGSAGSGDNRAVRGSPDPAHATTEGLQEQDKKRPAVEDSAGSGDPRRALVDPPAAAAAIQRPDPPIPSIAAFTPHRKGLSGLTVAEYEVDLGQRDPR